MGNFQDLTGKRFGRLVATKYLGNSRWECQCDCGKTTSVVAYSLTTGNTKSCGCYRVEAGIIGSTIHGFAHTRLYNVWCAMKRRCNREKDKRYHNYGGRGIKMCEEWQNDFMSFYRWAMENGYDEDAEFGKVTIDRIDTNGNYEPSNCRFTDLKHQARNKTNNHRITVNGENLTLVEVAEKYKINYSTLLSRMNRRQDINDLIVEENYG